MLTPFQKTLIDAYYYILIADGMVDPKELSFGNLMIEKENISREDFVERLDRLNNEETDHVQKQLKQDMKNLSHQEQLKVVAYMVKIADVDGVKDPHEMTSIQSITQDLSLHVNDIIKMKQNLI